MDSFDLSQLAGEEAQTPYSPDISLEQAFNASRSRLRKLSDEDTVTPDQLAEEMKLTRERCTPCKRRE